MSYRRRLDALDAATRALRPDPDALAEALQAARARPSPASDGTADCPARTRIPSTSRVDRTRHPRGQRVAERLDRRGSSRLGGCAHRRRTGLACRRGCQGPGRARPLVRRVLRRH